MPKVTIWTNTVSQRLTALLAVMPLDDDTRTLMEDFKSHAEFQEAKLEAYEETIHWYGCGTGDCEHSTTQECVDALVKGISRETHRSETLLDQVVEIAHEMEARKAEVNRLAREIDVALHGEGGAAKQASLCDLVGPAKKMRERVDLLQYRGARTADAWGITRDPEELTLFETQALLGELTKAMQPLRRALWPESIESQVMDIFEERAGCSSCLFFFTDPEFLKGGCRLLIEEGNLEACEERIRRMKESES